MKHIKKFNESIEKATLALDYLKELHEIGGISSDVYGMISSEGFEDFSIDVLMGDDSDDETEIKKKVLRYLNYMGGISSDVYDEEMGNL